MHLHLDVRHRRDRSRACAVLTLGQCLEQCNQRMDDCDVRHGPTEDGCGRVGSFAGGPPGRYPHNDRQDRLARGHTMTSAFVATLIPALVFALATLPARASDYVAGPEDYLSAVRALVAGDTLTLRPGMYRDGLPLHDIHG